MTFHKRAGSCTLGRMPELAEVEFFRKCWDVGLRQRVLKVKLHGEKRLFRGSKPAQIARVLKGAILRGSETRGKQIALRFSHDAWLGLHLGMTGKLRVEAKDFAPERHDHLVLFQAKRALVFTDARMFGRVRFHVGKEPPAWWASARPAVMSPDFTLPYLRAQLARRKLALKAVLLRQELFPGVGNWMADEILWRARLDPRLLSSGLSAPQLRKLWNETREVCRVSLETIGADWSDPPEGWLIHVRWKRAGLCPRDRTPLRRATIGGRTTAWCAKCQERKPSVAP